MTTLSIIPTIKEGPSGHDLCTFFMYQYAARFNPPLSFKFTPGRPKAAASIDRPELAMNEVGITDLDKDYLLEVVWLGGLTEIDRDVWGVLLHGRIVECAKPHREIAKRVETRLRYDPDTRYGEIQFIHLFS